MVRKSKSAQLVDSTYEAAKGDHARVIREMKKLITLGKKTGDSVLVGAAYYYIGYIAYDLDDRDLIFSSALKAVAFLKDSRETLFIVKAYILLGYAYSRQENFQMELVNYEMAYALIKRHRMSGLTLITILNDLSSCYHTMERNKAAIKMQTECIALQKKEFPDDYTSLAMYSINLATYYKDSDEVQKSLEVLEEMRTWIDKVEIKPLACDFYLRVARTAFDMKDVKKATESIDQAFALMPTTVYPHPVYDDLRQVSHHLVENGDKERAKHIYKLMEVYAENNPGTIEQLIAYRTMAEYNAAFGKTKEALKMYAKVDELFVTRFEEVNEDQLNLHQRMLDANKEIGKLSKQIRQSEELASREPLTKLLNRAALLRTASDFIEAAEEKKAKVGAIFIDIDFFKECNDTYGHAKGDEIIRTVADVCRKEESANVRFARYGGDEFFGITKGLSDEKVCEIARRICRRIREMDIPNEKNPNGHRVTLSVGIANVRITGKTDTIIEIANYADKAVYYAKNAGKNAIFLLDHGHKDENGKDSPFVKIDF